MKQLLMITAILCTTVFANTDLELKEPRWEAKFNGYTCAAYSETVDTPASHKAYDVNFEVLRTDRSLDNGLLLATFKEDNSVCRYSALLFADNDASTIDLVESRAFAINGDSECLNGKAMLDENLTANDYLYWGHPHHATIMMPTASVKSSCGEMATHIGVDFLVTGLIKK